MKTIRVLLLTVLAWLVLPPDAAAFYNPSSGRWLNRDPLNELGHQVLLEKRRFRLNLNEEKSLYAFVGNDGVNRWDNLGLYGGVNYCIPGFNCPIRLKRCGTVISRAIEATDDPNLWELFHNAVTGVLAPHQFLILDDGTRLTHGGTADGDNHWTARGKPIYIDSCKSCSEFTKCMKNNWPKDDDLYFPGIRDCQWAVSSTVSKCGGLINPPFWVN